MRIMKRLSFAATAAMLALVIAPTAAFAAGDAQLTPGDIGHMIAAIVVFAVLLLVLRRWAWKPIVSQLRRREKDIAEALSRAEQRETEAGELLERYQGRLANAEAEAEKMLARYRQQAVEAHDELLEAARAETKESREKSRMELEAAKKEALQELRDTTAELATDIAGRVLKKKLSAEDQRNLLDESLKQIQEQAGSQEGN